MKLIMTLFRRLVLILALLTMTCTVNAYDFAVDGLCYNIIDVDGTKCAEVTQGTAGQPGYNGKIVIPASVSNQGVSYRVTTIGELAFCYYDDLISVELPNTITTIGSDAFSDCPNLTSITLPESLEKIDDNAFAGSGLTTIYIPKNVNSLYRNVFSRCSNLRMITVDPANTAYDSRENCNAIIQTDGDLLLTGCMNSVIPNDVWDIGISAFNGCTGLTSIELHDHFGSIAYYAFAGCENLASITFPNSMCCIGDEAFYGCSSLTSIHLPAHLTSLGEQPFINCSGITSITVDPDNKTYDSRNDCNAIIDKKNNILLIGCQNTTIPEDVVAIGKSAFSGCTGLTSIVLPNSVTTINSYAFEGCTSLVSVSIPNTITKLSSGAFRGCSSLEAFVIPEGITNLESVLYGCENLKSIVIPAGITKMNYTVFNDCKSLESIVVAEGNTVFDSRNNCNAIIETATNKLVVGCKTTVIPSDVVEIGNYAFRGSGLVSITIPDAVAKIGNAVFEDCSSLSTVKLPENLSELGQSVFEDCSSLKEIVIPDGITKLGSNILRNCSSLVSVSFSDAITEIGNHTFMGTAITAIILPATLNKLGVRPFYKCMQLSDITVKSLTPIAINDETFYNISKLTLYVPEGSKEAYETADYWKDFKEIKEGVGPDSKGYILGDANNDRQITVADYTAIVHHILGKTPANFNAKAADVNKDNNINMADYTGVVHLILYGTVVKPSNK